MCVYSDIASTYCKRAKRLLQRNYNYLSTLEAKAYIIKHNCYAQLMFFKLCVYTVHAQMRNTSAHEIFVKNNKSQAALKYILYLNADVSAKEKITHG